MKALRTITVCFWVMLATLVRGQSIAPLEEWTVDLSKPAKSKSIEIVRGTSREIRPSVIYNGAWSFPANATVTMRYKTASMTNTYYALTGSVHNATGGVLNISWTPAAEGSNSAYSFEIEAATGTTAQISISGTLLLKDSLTTYSSAGTPTNYSPWTDADAVEAAARIAGDLAGSNNVMAARDWATNLFLRATNISGDVWGILLPGE